LALPPLANAGDLAAEAILARRIAVEVADEAAARQS